MAKKTKAKAKSTRSTASSWWNERSKVLTKKTESKPTKAKKGRARAKKASKTEKGKMYYCETCGCEMVCVEPGEESVITCCDEPMLVVTV